MDIRTLIAETLVKRFNEGIVQGASRSNEVELHAPPLGPVFQGTRSEFHPMIHRDGARALNFFRKVSDSMCLSSERSATSCSNRCSPLPPGATVGVHSCPDARTSFSSCRKWPR